LWSRIISTEDLGRFLDYAARARANPHFDLEERDHRLDVAQRIRGMLDGAREGSLEPRMGVRTVFRGQYGGRPYSLTGPAQHRWLQAWADSDADTLMRGLIGFTAPGEGAGSRFAAFARASEEALSAGKIEPDPQALLALGSLFNFAVEPDSLPVVRADLYAPLEQAIGREPPADASLEEQYEHHLEVARLLRSEMEQAGIPIRDMIDAQSIVWLAAEQYELWAAAAEDGPPGGADLNGAAARRASRRPDSYLAICGVYRDEASYLAEWIEFHRLVGVEKFFLYDNKSTDNHLEVLKPYIDDGTVTLHDWPHFPAAQHSAYDHCLREHSQAARWIAFIDLDEFLFSPTYRPLPEVLGEFEAWPAVGVNSVFFGTSGHRTRPAGLVVENYTENDSGEGKLAIKSIVDPMRAVRCESVHHFSYTHGLAVNENGYPIQAQFAKSVSHSVLRINHYWAKSVEQFRAKCAQPGAANGYFRPWYDMSRLRGGRVNETSYAILKYAPALRAAVGHVAAGRYLPAVADEEAE
jgi:Glycosyltransferase family 92